MLSLDEELRKINVALAMGTPLREDEPHVHFWFACFRRTDPAPAIVQDCSCGARRTIYPGPPGAPEIVLEADATKPGGSIANALVAYTREAGLQSLLGDPHGEARRLLNGASQ